MRATKKRTRYAGATDMNYYRHHIGDYLRDTAHLTVVEDGVYRRLLDLYYMREQPLSPDLSTVCRLIRVRADDERAAVSAVLSEFFAMGDDGCWHQKRADAEIEIAHDAAERARTNGKAGGRPRKTQNADSGIPNKTKTKPTENPEETHPVISGIAKPNPEKSSPSPIPQPPVEDSVTNVTGAVAPRALPPKDFVFLHGLSLLTTTGMPEPSARSFLGKCCAAHGDDATAAAVDEAIRYSAGDPLPYIRKLLSSASNGGARVSRQQAEAERRRAHNAEVLGIFS